MGSQYSGREGGALASWTGSKEPVGTFSRAAHVPPQVEVRSKCNIIRVTGERRPGAQDAGREIGGDRIEIEGRDAIGDPWQRHRILPGDQPVRRPSLRARGPGPLRHVLGLDPAPGGLAEG